MSSEITRLVNTDLVQWVDGRATSTVVKVAGEEAFIIVGTLDDWLAKVNPPVAIDEIKRYEKSMKRYEKSMRG